MYEYNILVCQVGSEPEPLGGTALKTVWGKHIAH